MRLRLRLDDHDAQHGREHQRQDRNVVAHRAARICRIILDLTYRFALNAPLPGMRHPDALNTVYYDTAPEYLASDFATSFAANGFCGGGCGPIGLAFDSSNNLLVVDQADGFIYRFDSIGGVGMGGMSGGIGGAIHAAGFAK